MSSTTISRGNILEQFVIAPTLTPVALTTSSTQSLQTFAIAGLQSSDIVTFLQYQGNQTSNIIISNCDVASAGVLTVQFQNTSGAATAITPASGVYDFKVHRVEGLPVATNAA
jgi:hypothetical protein